MLIHKGGGTLKDKTSIYSIWNGGGLKLEGKARINYQRDSVGSCLYKDGRHSENVDDSRKKNKIQSNQHWAGKILIFYSSNRIPRELLTLDKTLFHGGKEIFNTTKITFSEHEKKVLSSAMEARNGRCIRSHSQFSQKIKVFFF